MSEKTYIVPIEKQDEAIASLKAQTGITIVKPTGVIDTHGVKLQYVLSGTNLTVTILHKPFYIPESAIWGPLDEHLKG